MRPGRRGHPAAANSRQSRNRSVSRAPYSRPAGDLNSADPYNLLIAAIRRAPSACGAAFRFSMSAPMRSRRNSRESATRSMPPTGALHGNLSTAQSGSPRSHRLFPQLTPHYPSDYDSDNTNYRFVQRERLSSSPSTDTSFFFSIKHDSRFLVRMYLRLRG